MILRRSALLLAAALTATGTAPGLAAMCSEQVDGASR